MKIIKEQKEKLGKTAAHLLKKSVAAIQKEKSHVVLGLVGGRSVEGLFEELKNENIPWDKIIIVMVDERLVPLDSPDSNFNQAYESFLCQLIEENKLPKEHVFPMKFKERQPDSGVGEYQESLKKAGGRFDIILLSAGEDGHVAALFPNHPSIKDESEFFVTMNDSPKPPPKRMSASRKLISKSRFAFLFFAGEGKRSAYEKFNDDSVDLVSCPAKIVKSIRDSYVLTDLC